jgi:hypothetical protein
MSDVNTNSPSGGGFFSFLRSTGRSDGRPGFTFAERLGQAAAILSPLNPASRTFIEESERSLQRREADFTRNQSVSELKRRADAGDTLAARYLSAIETGAIAPGPGFGSYLQELSREEQFNRQQGAIAGREQAKLTRETEMRNKTAEMLRAQGMEGAASLVEGGLFTGPQAIEFARSNEKAALAERAAAAIQAGNNQEAMAILTQLSPAAMGQQLAVQAAKTQELTMPQILDQGAVTVTYPDGDINNPEVTVNEEVIAARNAVKEQTKELPTRLQAEEETDFNNISTVDNLSAAIQNVVDLFGYNDKTSQFKGPLKLGVDAYVTGKLGGVGLGGKETSELASARSRYSELLNIIVNESLRLNKGPQTEGDAIRAANELQAASDERTALAALENLLKVNERKRQLTIRKIMNRRERYGVSTDVPIPEPIEMPKLNWKIVKP